MGDDGRRHGWRHGRHGHDGADDGGPPGSIREVWGAAKANGVLFPGRVTPDGQVYVSNLPVDTTDVDLYKLFCGFGPIAPNGVKAMLNEDGTCKGIGFVDFLDPAAAQMAIASLNGCTTNTGGYINCALKIAKTDKGGDSKGAAAKGKGKGKATKASW